MTPPDALRELAERAGMLRPCEGLHTLTVSSIAGGQVRTNTQIHVAPLCPICGGTGRRLPTLDEVLAAQPAGWTLWDDTRPGEVLVEPYGCGIDDVHVRRGDTPLLAALRLCADQVDVVGLEGR